MSKFITFSNGLTFLEHDFDILKYCEKNKVKVVKRHSYQPRYNYKFNDGTEKELTKLGCLIWEKLHGVKKVSGGPLGFYTKSGSNDPYSGYNVGLGCEVRGKGHYKNLLKERGLIEVGNEKEYVDKMKPTPKKLLEESDLRDLANAGAQISDGEAKKLLEN